MHAGKDLFLSLTGGLRFNNKRWKKQMDTFQKGSSSQVGDLLVSSSGALNQAFSTNTSERSKLSGYLPAQNLDFFNTQQQQTNEQQQPASTETTTTTTSSEMQDMPIRPYKPKTEAQIVALRTEHKIHVKGNDIAEPLSHFDELVSLYKVKKYILKNIANSKYKEPTPIQRQAIPVLLQGKEMLASAPTGSGKTASFAIPILSFLKEPAKEGFRAIVIAPTRVLVDQLYRDFLVFAKGKDWRICIGSSTQKEKFKSKRNDVLICTPKWLCQMIKEDAFSLSAVQRLVLDEADRLFEMGFLDQIDQIITACSHPKIVRCLFSATIPFGVEHMCSTFLRDPIRILIGVRNAGADTVTQKLLFTGSEAGKLLAVRQQFKQGIAPPVLIFVQSIERAKQLYNELMFEGIPIDYIHGQRSETQTKEVVNNFRLGKIWVLICTDVMARGLDFKGVSMVINYDFPTSMISYIHRIGRTGRAGRTGEAITYFSYEDLDMLRNIADVMKKSGCDVPDWMLELDKMSSTDMKKRERRPVERDAISGDTVHNDSKFVIAKPKPNQKRKRETTSSTFKPNKKQRKV